MYLNRTLNVTHLQLHSANLSPIAAMIKKKRIHRHPKGSKLQQGEPITINVNGMEMTVVQLPPGSQQIIIDTSKMGPPVGVNTTPTQYSHDDTTVTTTSSSSQENDQEKERGRLRFFLWGRLTKFLLTTIMTSVSGICRAQIIFKSGFDWWKDAINTTCISWKLLSPHSVPTSQH